MDEIIIVVSVHEGQFRASFSASQNLLIEDYTCTALPYEKDAPAGQTISHEAHFMPLLIKLGATSEPLRISGIALPTTLALANGSPLEYVGDHCRGEMGPRVTNYMIVVDRN